MARAAAVLAAAAAVVCATAAGAATDDAVWRGSLATDKEVSCQFTEIPATATVTGGTVAIRLTFKGAKRTFEASVGGDASFQAYSRWHTWPGYEDGGNQRAAVKGTVGDGVLEANFWTIDVPRRFCTAKLRLTRTAPEPPPTVVAAPAPPAAPPSPPALAPPALAPPAAAPPAMAPPPQSTPAPVAAAPAEQPDSGLIAQLDTLQALRDKGLIDEAEFETRRTALLDRFVGVPPAAKEPAAPVAAAPADDVRIALVVGNSAYATAPLANPENDARLMAATLRSVGFDVAELINADQKAMKRAIRDFGERLDRAGGRAVALFYYAGHGVQVDGRNYLIPVGSRISREGDVDLESVAADSVLRTLAYARTRTNLVILDACRNNPYARGFRSLSTGLARMDAPQGTLIAYATAPGQVAADGTGVNSPYTAALAQAIVQYPEPVEQVLKRVRLRVMAATREAQVPWEASSLTRDFFFRR